MPVHTRRVPQAALRQHSAKNSAMRTVTYPGTLCSLSRAEREIWALQDSESNSSCLVLLVVH
eukprot:3864874-Rhodomonas_salina.1